ncbi:unnamed protein product [Allacma fusca]|uniref:Uncharacterized protein n=1 Tax=Allacma fusca TaxID=39272 RepID=A0A8J2J6S3_9HEXA|nr:unnamed protein product [Allacma fusca]
MKTTLLYAIVTIIHQNLENDPSKGFCQLTILPQVTTELTLHTMNLQQDLLEEFQFLNIPYEIAFLSKYKYILEAKKFSSYCSHVVIILDEYHPGLPNFGTTTSTTSFLLLGTKRLIEAVFSTGIINKLKIKTGLFLENDQWKMVRYFEDKPSESIFKISMEGRRLQIGSLPLKPYLIMDENHVIISGVSWLLMTAVSTNYNFTFTRQATNSDNNHPMQNGTHQGLAGDLIEGKIDVLLPHAPSVPGLKYMDFTTSIMTFNLCFFFSHPKTGVEWRAIFYPFQRNVWFLLICTCFTVSLLLVAFTAGSKSNLKLIHFIHAMLPFRLLLQQCPQKIKTSRNVVVQFLFFSVVINTYYNSNLLVYLTFPKPENLPGTVEQLLDRPEFKIMTWQIPGGFTDTFLKSSGSVVLTALRKRLEQKQSDFNCIRDSILQEKTTCVATNVRVETVIATNFTVRSHFNPLVKSESILTSSACMALRKHSRYFSFFRTVMGWLKDSGMVSKWYDVAIAVLRQRGQLWLKTQEHTDAYAYRILRAQADNFHGNGVKALQVGNLRVAFVAWLGGLILGVFVIGLEFMNLAYVRARLVFLRVRLVKYGYRP